MPEVDVWLSGSFALPGGERLMLISRNQHVGGSSVGSLRFQAGDFREVRIVCDDRGINSECTAGDHSPGNGIRKTYIACTNPAYELAAKTQEWVRRQGDWQYVEFSSGHDAMVISPEAFAEMLIGCCA